MEANFIPRSPRRPKRGKQPLQFLCPCFVSCRVQTSQHQGWSLWHPRRKAEGGQIHPAGHSRGPHSCLWFLRPPSKGPENLSHLEVPYPMSHSCRKSLTLVVHMASGNESRLELDLRLSTETSPTSEETCRLLTGHLNVNRCGGGSPPRLGVGEGWVVRKRCTKEVFAAYLGRMGTDKGIPGSGRD